MQSDLKLIYDNPRGLFYIIKKDKFNNDFNSFGVAYKENDLKQILYHLVINENTLIDIKDKSIPLDFKLFLEKKAINGDANYFKKIKKKDGSEKTIPLVRKELSITEYLNYLYLESFLSSF